MNTFIEKIEKSKDDPSDLSSHEVVIPAFDPQGSNLPTPINSSKIVRALFSSMPAYRAGLSPIRRGLEVGVVHGYWLLGPFFKFNPLRYSERGAEAALLSTIALVAISAGTIVMYGATNPPPQIITITVPDQKDVFNSFKGWSGYALGFLIGGVMGAVLAYEIVKNVDVFKNSLHIIGL